MYHYPETKLVPETYSLAGHQIEDPLLWLVDNQREDVLAWTKIQNDYTDAFFAPYRDRLNKYMEAMRRDAQKVSYSGVSRSGESLYGMRNGGDGTHSAVELDLDMNEKRVLLDNSTYPEGKVFAINPCPKHPDICAMWTLKSRAARMTVVVRNIKEDKTLFQLDGTFSFAWANDGSVLYYAEAVPREDGSLANFIRKVTVDTGANEIIHECKGHSVFVRITAYGKHGISAHIMRDYHQNDVLLIDDNGMETEIPGNGAALEYIGSAEGNDLFKTDLFDPCGSVVAIPAGETEIKAAKVVYSQKVGCLDSAAVIAGRLVTLHLEDASSVLRFRDPDGTNIITATLPEEFCTVSAMDFAPSDDPIFYLGYESFTCSPALLCCNAMTGTAELVFSNGEPRKDIIVEREFLKSFDGQQIVAFYVRKNSTIKTGFVPTLMYGYGGYNAAHHICSKAVDMDICDWADKGGLYVHCILRGGCEYGEEWHQGGNLLNKKNVFMDYAAIADHTIKTGWTDRSHLAITGLSNGGLLVTATATLYPQYFACVLASVPHTDMLHFCLDDRGSMYTTEYGDPNDPKFFDYMKSYSPYHNLKEGVNYPAFYVQTGEYDNNVPPYHGKKFAAKLQSLGLEVPTVLRVLPYGSHDRGEGEYLFKTAAELAVFRDLMLGVE